MGPVLGGAHGHPIDAVGVGVAVTQFENGVADQVGNLFDPGQDRGTFECVDESFVGVTLAEVGEQLLVGFGRL